MTVLNNLIVLDLTRVLAGTILQHATGRYGR